MTQGITWLVALGLQCKAHSAKLYERYRISSQCCAPTQASSLQTREQGPQVLLRLSLAAIAPKGAVRMPYTSLIVDREVAAQIWTLR